MRNSQKLCALIVFGAAACGLVNCADSDEYNPSGAGSSGRAGSAGNANAGAGGARAGAGGSVSAGTGGDEPTAGAMSNAGAGGATAGAGGAAAGAGGATAGAGGAMAGAGGAMAGAGGANANGGAGGAVAGAGGTGGMGGSNAGAGGAPPIAGAGGAAAGAGGAAGSGGFGGTNGGAGGAAGSGGFGGTNGGANANGGAGGAAGSGGFGGTNGGAGGAAGSGGSGGTTCAPATNFVELFDFPDATTLFTTDTDPGNGPGKWTLSRYGSVPDGAGGLAQPNRLAFSATDGDPAPGSAKATLPFTGAAATPKSQAALVYNIAPYGQPGMLANVSGRVFSARVRVLTNPHTNCTFAAQAWSTSDLGALGQDFTKSGATTPVTLPVGTWVTATFDLDASPNKLRVNQVGVDYVATCVDPVVGTGDTVIELDHATIACK